MGHTNRANIEPAIQSVGSETEFLDMNLIWPTPVDGTVTAVIWNEIRRIYDNGTTGTNHYRTYLTVRKLASDFSSFTDLTAETLIDDFSAPASSAGWQDGSWAQGYISVGSTLSDSEMLVVRVRKTAWNVPGAGISYGLSCESACAVGVLIE